MDREHPDNITGSGNSYVCPPGHYDCLNNRVSDSQIKTACVQHACPSLYGFALSCPQTWSLCRLTLFHLPACHACRLWVSVAAGAVILLLFGIARSHLATYKLRLVGSVSC